MKKKFDTEKKYYVYKWFNIENQHVFYVGKGTGERACRKSAGSRNKYFIRYVASHPCDYQIIEQNLDEKEALQKEYQLIKFYKEKGECECNFDTVNPSTGNAHLVGSLNGMWHKKHSLETKQKISSINSDGRFKGENNPQYKISPKERMSPEQYELWKQHRSVSMSNGGNPKARQVELYDSNHQLIQTFDCIKNCALYLKTELKISKNIDHLRHVILNHSKKQTDYHNYYFKIITK